VASTCVDAACPAWLTFHMHSLMSLCGSRNTGASGVAPPARVVAAQEWQTRLRDLLLQHPQVVAAHCASAAGRSRGVGRQPAITRPVTSPGPHAAA
jgi:hypothetical protein